MGRVLIYVRSRHLSIAEEAAKSLRETGKTVGIRRLGRFNPNQIEKVDVVLVSEMDSDVAKAYAAAGVAVHAFDVPQDEPGFAQVGASPGQPPVKLVGEATAETTNDAGAGEPADDASGAAAQDAGTEGAAQ